jgi:hypothetical protein
MKIGPITDLIEGVGIAFACIIMTLLAVALVGLCLIVIKNVWAAVLQ